MRLSSRGRYAARLMLDLALHQGDGLILLKDIAERQEISMKYLSQLLTPLKSAGLVTASRGAHGGYRLAAAPTQITLGQVIRAVTGDISLVECVNCPEVCDRVGSCVTREIWADLGKKLTETLNAITLQDMADRYRRKLESQSLMWNI
jgi:Rrf2 family protein